MGKRTVTSVKRRRMPKPRRRRVRQTLPALGLGMLRLLRNFTLYPKQVASSTPATSWLDSLVKYGAIAMKLFLAAVAYTRDVGATLAPCAAVQCIAVGPEDLLWSSAIKEVRKINVLDDKGAEITLSCPCIDYRQARLRQLCVRVTPSSDMAKRGGRICIAIVPLTLAEAEKAVAGTLVLTQLDFSLLIQMPGATLAPASRPVSKIWRPKSSDLGHEFRECGDSVTPTFRKQTPNGGYPVCLVYIGFQDMAGSKPDASVLYSPEEATFNVDMSGAVDLREYGTSYIRKYPRVLFNSSSVGVVHPDNLRPVDYQLQDLSRVGDCLALPDSVLCSDLKAAFGSHEPATLSGFSDLGIGSPAS